MTLAKSMRSAKPAKLLYSTKLIGFIVATLVDFSVFSLRICPEKLRKIEKNFYCNAYSEVFYLVFQLLYNLIACYVILSVFHWIRKGRLDIIKN